MRFLPLFVFLSAAFTSCPLFAGPIVSLAKADIGEVLKSDADDPAGAGSVAALNNLNVFFDLIDSDDLSTSDGSSPEGNSETSGRVVTLNWTGLIIDREAGRYDLMHNVFFSGIFLTDRVLGSISAVAERATADGVVTTAESAFDIELTIEAHPDHGPVSLILDYDVAGESAITGAGMMGDEMFFGTAVANSTLTSGGVTLDSLEVSVNGNDTHDSEWTIEHPFTLAAGESVTFKISTMAQATATAVPEPSSFLLLGMLGLVGAWRQRISKSNSN